MVNFGPGWLTSPGLNFVYFVQMITFAKMISFMETIATVRTNEAARPKSSNKAKTKNTEKPRKKAAPKAQTVLRISPELMARVKYKARQVDVSVNAYIESVLREAVMPRIPRLPQDFEVSPLVKSLSGIIPAPTKEMLEEDPKLAYIIGKGGE